MLEWKARRIRRIEVRTPAAFSVQAVRPRRLARTARVVRSFHRASSPRSMSSGENARTTLAS